MPDLSQKLKNYVEAFNARDEEIFPQTVSNAQAYDFLAAQIPLLDCPDKELEKTYYFRWWTLRKHWKETPHGHILSEFLPPVPWAGPYNSINCPAGHHLREGRWLRDGAWMKEYISFWLDGHGDALSYSMWFASAIEAYLNLHPDDAFAAECLPKLIAWYEKREQKSLHACGLYWSQDGRDGMECSISGSGIRPTLNAYMYGDACAIARLARNAGQEDPAERFEQKAAQIKEKMDALLWDGDFYRVIPCQKDEPLPAERPEEHRVRELLGYTPWYFMMPDAEKDAAWAQLTDEEGFSAPYGLTTAERRHPRFLFEHEHECLWNGYVWPFATAQTLTALANALHAGRKLPLDQTDYFRMLKTYAHSHVLETERGETLPWIDEVMHPFTGEWSARRLLMEDHWNPKRGGYERGKDYNHSTFCDLVLSGLLGIERKNGRLCAEPLIPDDWDYFCVTGLTEENWTVLYDRTGERYGMGKGLQIFQKS